MKKLTDKIYIAESNSHPGFFAQEYFLPYRWTKFNSIEYIRKDALLGKIDDAIAHLSDGSLTGYYESLAYKDIRELIKSM